MKTILMILLLVPITAVGQLNRDADFIRQMKPDVWETLTERAESKWPDDYSMRVYEINKQAQALMDYVDLFQFYKSEGNKQAVHIIILAAKKWYQGPEGEWKGELDAKIDWSMVLHEANKQLDAWFVLQ